MGLKTEDVRNITKAISVSSHPAGQGVAPGRQSNFRSTQGGGAPLPAWRVDGPQEPSQEALLQPSPWAGSGQVGSSPAVLEAGLGLSMGRGSMG